MAETRCAKIGSVTGGEAANIAQQGNRCVFRPELLPPVGAVK